jgi:hypothetical protein
VSDIGNSRTDFLDLVLHVTQGFTEADRPMVLSTLAGLEPHLARWDPADVGLDLAVKDRDGKDQEVTLRVALPAYPELVAKAADRDLERALARTKHKLIEQIEHEKSRWEPESNRMLRKSSGR